MRGCTVTGHFQQMGAYCVQAMVLGEAAIPVKGAEKLEPRPWSIHHCHGHGVIEGDYRIGEMRSSST
jgi:hypothetical protein